MSNAQRVKEAARGNWPELLVALGGVPREWLDGKHHPCPKCGGHDRFRLIDEREGAVLCNQCFSEKNGDGLAALSWLRDQKFPDTLELVARELGVELEKRKRGASKAREALELLPWHEGLVAMWAAKKGGISVESVRENGGERAQWRGPDGKDYVVIAVPIVGHLKNDPRGWTFYNTTGGPLPVKGSDPVKVRSTARAGRGWLGLAGIRALKDAKVVWLTEGLSDMLSLYTAIPAPARGVHIVLSNPFGAAENPRPELLDALTGKLVVILTDRDDAGRRRGERWGPPVARLAQECRVLEIPGPGKDVRDWLLAGGTLEQLREFARAVEPLRRPEDDPESTGDWEEDLHDPSRLGREYVRYTAGRWRRWRGDSYRWSDGVWRRETDEDAKHDVIWWLREEIRRICAARRTEKPSDDEPAKCKQITTPFVASVRTCAEAYASVPSWVRWCSELEVTDDGLSRCQGAHRRNWLAFRNGLLDLDQVLAGDPPEILDHRAGWWSQNLLPYDYDPTAQIGPYWRAFLQENIEGDDDRITILQEWAGYCLVHWTDLQSCLILEGEGANGKSVYCAVLEALLGEENVSHVPLELFGQRFALWPTYGKLANIVTEVGELEKTDEGLFKAYVSGEEIPFERKGRDTVQAPATARITIATNNLPRFSDRSGGLWRRLQLLRFNYQVPEGRRILGMDKTAWWARGPGSGEMPGIFNWALDGLARLRTQGRFSPNESMDEAVREYRIESNPAREFLLETYEVAPTDDWSLECREAYKAYSSWSKENGYRALGERTFGKEVRRAFPLVRRVFRGSRELRKWHYTPLRTIERIENTWHT